MASRSGSPEAPAWPGPPMFRAPEDPMEDPLASPTSGPQPSKAEPEDPGAPSSLWTPQSAHESPMGSTPGPDDFAAPSHEDASEAQPGDKPNKAGRSRTSSASEREAIRQTIAGAATLGTSWAHEHMTRDNYERAVLLYVASDKEIDGVAKHASALAARHASVEGIDNPDLQDGIQILFALASYVTTQWMRLKEAAALRRHVATSQLDTGEGEGLS